MTDFGFGAAKGGVGDTSVGWTSMAKPRPNKVVLIGHGEACETLAEIAVRLRSERILASVYRDGNVLHAIQELMSSAAFLVIGLSRAGRQINEVNSKGILDSSRVQADEKRVLDIVATMPSPIPCAVVSDIDGYISAPYLVMHGGLVRIVATNDPKVDSLGIFSNHKKVPRSTTDIVAAIKEYLAAP